METKKSSVEEQKKKEVSIIEGLTRILEKKTYWQTY